MNIFSFLSSIIGTAFLIGGIYCFTRNRKAILNVFSFLVMISLGWWNLCNSFFFCAETKEMAFLWHHLASLGWTCFISETTYYFIVLTGYISKMKKFWKQLLFNLVPVIITVYNLFGSTTSLATDLTAGSAGSKWAFVNSLNNFWLWAYVLYISAYFSFAFYLLIRWSFKVKHRLKKKMAIAFVLLDALTIVLGAIFEIISPITGNHLPPVANLCTAIFGLGYFVIIIRFDLFNVRNVVEDRYVIRHSMEPLMVTDENGEILDYNPACAELFQAQGTRLVGENIKNYFDRDKYLLKIGKPLTTLDSIENIQIPFNTKFGNQRILMVSGAIIRDKQHEYMGTVLSLRDITQLVNLKDRYRVQSEEYQKLAFIDTLTGLPNRRRAFEYMNKCLVNYNKGGLDFFILYMDMNNFKAVNDRYGHNAGDRFLIEVAARLNSCIADGLEFLARLSGDEFLMVGTAENPEEVMPQYARKIEEEFSKEFIIDDAHITSGISVGYAKYSEYRNIDALMHHADEMMYLKKQKQR